MKKYIAFLVAASLLLALSGCSAKETGVYVQKVADLTAMGSIGASDRFGGIVVSESVTEIQKDSDKTIAELFVREGDDVSEGQELFSYDTEELQLNLEKQILQVEQLEATIENAKAQIEKLEKELERASSNTKPELFIQLRTAQIEQTESELNLKTKQGEVKKSQHLLENAVVSSPVTGRVTAIGGNSEESGSDKAYITIQKTGSYRVKGTLNEMQRGNILEGQRIRMESRLNPEESWLGTVSLVDYENPVQGNNNGMYNSNSDEMGNSSRYPFYVELDSSDGMLLGQHLYLSVEQEEAPQLAGVLLSGTFVAYDDEGNSFVWAESTQGKLEKRMVVTGEYDYMNDMVEILDGLTEEDFIAFPDEEVCKEGAPTTRTQREGGVK